MADCYHITVKYDATDGILKIEPTKKRGLILAANTSPVHSLVWNFEGIEGLVAAGWSPGIKFVLAPQDELPQYSGPFINLTRTTSSVIASGNTGQVGKYAYSAILKPPPKSISPDIESTRAHLYNEVPERTLAVVKVTVPAEGLLQVEPEDVAFTFGQSILWEVVNERQERGKWYPRLIFVDGPSGMNAHFGPFTSMDTRDGAILASGSAQQGQGKYKYLFQMVSVESGEVQFESSPDPTVDDEGDPTGGGIGGN